MRLCCPLYAAVAVAERPAKPPHVYPRTSALKEVHIVTEYRWCLEDSVFASYNMDTTALLRKCFSEDFAMGKVRGCAGGGAHQQARRMTVVLTPSCSLHR